MSAVSYAIGYIGHNHINDQCYGSIAFWGFFLLTATYHTMPPVFLFSEMFFLIYFSAVKVNSFGCASSPSVESSHLET